MPKDLLTDHEIVSLLKDTYKLEDLNKAEIPNIRALHQKIDKIQGMMSLRSKKVNQIMENLRKMILKSS